MGWWAGYLISVDTARGPVRMAGWQNFWKGSARLPGDEEETMGSRTEGEQLEGEARAKLMRRTKADLVSTLAEVLGNNRRLRGRLWEFEHASPAEQDARAVQHLARRVAEHLAADGEEVDAIQAEEHRERLLKMLRGMLKAQAIMALVEVDTEVLSSCLSSKRSDSWSMVHALDDAQERMAKQLVEALGARDLVAQLVRLQREREE
jgi:hypothetical protein